MPQAAPGLAAAAVAGPIGGAAAAGVAGGMGAFGSDYVSTFLEGLREEGVDISNPEAIRKAAADPALMDRAGKAAFAHASAVGLFDGASMGLAGRGVLPKAVLAGRPGARAAAEMGAQLPVQAGLGAAGEAAGQVAAGQEIKPGQIMAEAVGEMFSAPAEVAATAAGQARRAFIANADEVGVDEFARAADAARSTPDQVAPNDAQPSPAPGAAPAGGGPGVAVPAAPEAQPAPRPDAVPQAEGRDAGAPGAEPLRGPAPGESALAPAGLFEDLIPAQPALEEGDLRLLIAAGNTPEMIADMNRAARAETIKEAKEAGIQPYEGDLADVGVKAGAGEGPEAPVAGPLANPSNVPSSRETPVAESAGQDPADVMGGMREGSSAPSNTETLAAADGSGKPLDSPLNNEAPAPVDLKVNEPVPAGAFGQSERDFAAAANAEPEGEAKPVERAINSKAMAAVWDGRNVDDEGRYVERGGQRYVARPDGSDALGEITPEIGTAIGREPAPIRLPEGTDKFGERHIERRHGEQIRAAGYPDVATFVSDVAASFSEVYEARNKRLFLVKQDGASKAAVVELRRAGTPEDATWSVTTAGLYRPEYFARQTLLWRRPGPDDSPPSSGSPFDPEGQSGPSVAPSQKADEGPRPAPVNKGQRAPRSPKSLLEFLAHRGGLAPHGDLAHMGADRTFVPGFGRLVRKGGTNLDEAREAAQQAGYGRFLETEADILALIRENVDKRARTLTERDELHAQPAKIDKDEEEHRAYQAIVSYLDDAGLRSEDVDPEAADLAARMLVTGEETIENAYERAILQIEARGNPKKVAQRLQEEDIPFDVDESQSPDERSDREGAEDHPGGRAERARAEGASAAPAARPRAAEDPGVEALPGEDARDAGAAEAAQAGEAPEAAEVTVEPGADGKPQAVIPGAERISQGDLAKRKAQEGLKPKAPQKDTDGLALFGDSRNQGDLLDQPAAKPEPEVKRALFAKHFGDLAGADSLREVVEPFIRGEATLPETRRALRDTLDEVLSLERSADKRAAARKRVLGALSALAKEMKSAPPTSLSTRRARTLSGSLTGTRIEAPESLFTWLGLEAREFFADFAYVRSKHPKDFANAQAARNHVLDVLTSAETAIFQKRGTIALYASLDADRMIAFEAEPRQGRYQVLTAFVLRRGQLARNLKGAERDGALAIHRSIASEASGPETQSRGAARAYPQDSRPAEPDSSTDPEPRASAEQPSAPSLETALHTAIQRGLVEMLVRHMAGHHVDVAFVDVPTHTPESMRASGARDDRAIPLASYTANRLIEFSREGLSTDTAYHEVAHLLQHVGAYTEAEVKLLDRERERNRGIVARVYGFSREEAARLPDEEVDAYAAGVFGLNIEAGKAADNRAFHIGAQRIFTRIHELVRRILNYLRGHGFEITEDIVARQGSGIMRERLDSGFKGAGYGPLHTWQEAFDAWVAANGSPSQASTRRAGFSKAAQDEVSQRNAATGSPPAPRPPSDATFGAPEETRLDRYRTSQQDAFRRLEKVQAVIEEARGAPLAEPLDAYLAQTLAPGRTAERIEDFRRGDLKDLIKEAKGLSTDDIGLYLIAKHAPPRNAVMAERDPERFAAGGGSGMTDETAAEMIVRFRAEGKEAQLDRVAQRVYKILAADREQRYAADLISDETLAHWENVFADGNYVPLRGTAERDEDAQSSHFGRGFDIRGRESPYALGRLSLSDNPLSHAIHMREEGIVRAEKNRAGKAILRLVQQNPNPEEWEVVRNPTTKVLDEASGQVRERPDNLAKSDPNVLGVKVGGVPYYIRFKNEGLASAYKNLGAPEFEKLMRSVVKGTRLYASLQTGRNPAFFMSNFVRDVQEAITTVGIEGGARLVKAFLRNLMPAFRAAMWKGVGQSAGEHWDARYDEWRLNGGKIGNYAFRDVQSVQEDIERMLREMEQGRLKRWPKDGVRGLVGLVDGLNEVFESTTRLAVFAAARETGMSPARSARLAREATVNFTKRGGSKMSATLRGLFVFYNANIQGNAKHVQQLVRSKGFRTLYVGLIGLGLGMTFLNRLMFGDEKDDPEKRRPYDKIPIWERESHIIIPTGTKKDQHGNVELTYFKIPLMFGAKIPYFLGEQIANVLMGSVKPGKAAVNVVVNTIDAFNPLGSGSPITMVFPTLAKPLSELAVNSDWRQRRIYPESDRRTNEGVPRSSQPTSPSANPVYQTVTEKVNELTGGSRFEPGLVDVYPGAVEYGVNWVTGGLGRFVANGLQVGYNHLNGIPTPVEKWPLANRFMGETGLAGEQSRYYEFRKEADGHKNRFTIARKTLADKPDALAEATVEREAHYLGVNPNPKKKNGQPSKRMKWSEGVAASFKEADDDIKELKQEKLVLQSDPKLTALEKHRRVDDINRQIQARMREARGDAMDRIGR